MPLRKAINFYLDGKPLTTILYGEIRETPSGEHAQLIEVHAKYSTIQLLYHPDKFTVETTAWLRWPLLKAGNEAI